MWVGDGGKVSGGGDGRGGGVEPLPSIWKLPVLLQTTNEHSD